jgi:hypothetical protein
MLKDAKPRRTGRARRQFTIIDWVFAGSLTVVISYALVLASKHTNKPGWDNLMAFVDYHFTSYDWFAYWTVRVFFFAAWVVWVFWGRNLRHEALPLLFAVPGIGTGGIMFYPHQITEMWLKSASWVGCAFLFFATVMWVESFSARKR